MGKKSIIPDIDLLYNSQTSIEVVLKGSQRRISVTLNDDSATLAQDFALKHDLTQSTRLKIEIELLRAQLDVHSSIKKYFYDSVRRFERKFEKLEVENSSLNESMNRITKMVNETLCMDSTISTSDCGIERLCEQYSILKSNSNSFELQCASQKKLIQHLQARTIVAETKCAEYISVLEKFDRMFDTLEQKISFRMCDTDANLGHQCSLSESVDNKQEGNSNCVDSICVDTMSSQNVDTNSPALVIDFSVDQETDRNIVND